MPYGYADLFRENANASGTLKLVAANSLSTIQGDFIRNNGAGYAALGGANHKYVGVSRTKKTFAADNQTVAKDSVIMSGTGEANEYECICDQTITQADVGKWFTLTSSQLVDTSSGTFTKTSSLNLKLVEYVSANKGRFTIDNDIVD